MAEERHVVFWMSAGGFEQRLRLGMWVLTAASVGERVHVVLTGEALRRWCDGTFDAPEKGGETDRARAVALGLPAPAAMLHEAKSLSSVRIVSCGTEVLLAGITEEAVRPFVDEIVSLPSFWRETAGARFITLAR